MHVFLWEMKAQLKSLLIWSAIFIVIIFMMTSEFSAYYENPEMLDIMSSMPEALMKAFSMDGANLTTTVGYISIVALYFYLMGGLYAVLLGSGILSKEERDKTAEYLLTMPISRTRLILFKLLAALTCSVLLLLVVLGSTVVAMLPYDLDNDFFDFLWLMGAAMGLTMLLFLSIGLFLASILKRYKYSGKIATSLLMVLYFLSIIAALSDKLEFLKYVTPFKFFESSALISTGSLSTSSLVISLMIILLGVMGTFLFYPKRDLHL